MLLAFYGEFRLVLLVAVWEFYCCLVCVSFTWEGRLDCCICWGLYAGVDAMLLLYRAFSGQICCKELRWFLCCSLVAEVSCNLVFSDCVCSCVG